MQWGEDRRFDEMRDNLGKLAVFWIFQVIFATCALLLDLIMRFLRNSPGCFFFTVCAGCLGLVCQLARHCCECK